MTRIAASFAAVMLAAGCQTPSWNAWLKPDTEQPEYDVTHSAPASESSRGPRSWAKQQPPETPRDDSEALLKYATEQDNAHRRNPTDRESLRQARLAYERILQTNPQHAYVLHRLGTIADREGRFAEAEKYYQAAVQLNPNNVDLISDMGYSYLLQNRLPEAEQMLQQVLAINPRQPKARTNLGLVYAHVGRSGEAYELIRSEKSEAETRELLAQVARVANPQSAPEFDPNTSGLPTQTVRGQNGPASSQPAVPTGPVNEKTKELMAVLAKARQEQTAAKLSAPSPWNTTRGTTTPPGGYNQQTARVPAPQGVASDQVNPAFDANRGSNTLANQPQSITINGNPGHVTPAVTSQDWGPTGATPRWSQTDNRAPAPQDAWNQGNAPQTQGQLSSLPGQGQFPTSTVSQGNGWQGNSQQGSPPPGGLPPAQIPYAQGSYSQGTAVPGNALPGSVSQGSLSQNPWGSGSINPVGAVTSQPGRGDVISADARVQAAQIGMQIGGGMLFTTPPANSEVTPAPLQQAHLQQGYPQQGYPHAGLQPRYPAQAPSPSGTPANYLPPSSLPTNSSAAYPLPTDSLPSDEQVELLLLTEQAQQLQDQISRRRAELDRIRQTPGQQPW